MELEYKRTGFSQMELDDNVEKMNSSLKEMFIESKKEHSNEYQSGVDYDEEMLDVLDREQLWCYIDANNKSHEEYIKGLMLQLQDFIEGVEPTVDKGIDDNSNEPVEDGSDSIGSSDSEKDDQVLYGRKYEPSYLDQITEDVTDSIESEDDKDSLNDRFYKVSQFEGFATGMEEAVMNQEELKEIYENERKHMDTDEEDEDEWAYDEFDLAVTDDDEAVDIKYNDFFVAKKKKPDTLSKTTRRVQFNDDASNNEYYKENKEEKNLEGSSSEQQNGENLHDDEKSTAVKTDHEKKQDELLKRIQSLENKSISQKEWNLRGETRSLSRPENSLLEQGDMEVNYVMNSAPIMNQEQTDDFEELIKKRICTHDYDDVERKFTRTQAQLRKDVDDQKLEDELGKKSAYGLAEVYERDYAENTLGVKSKEDVKIEKQRHKVKDMFSKVMYKLDSLSSFYFVPKPVASLNKLQAREKTTAAADLEDKIPVYQSVSTAKTPEELIEGKSGVRGVLKTSEEKTQEERRRERRDKKRLKRKLRYMRQREDRIIDHLNPGLGNKYAKQNMRKKLKGADDRLPEKLTNSSKFFASIQNEISEAKKSTHHITETKKKNFKL
eukprot:augustus_masked-scaffold_34-processed-gene-3.1-mRNA-1 protein AED:1.00 eAED:1.00 QI:0/-1/0/0/-1/1/1/0/607